MCVRLNSWVNGDYKKIFYQYYQQMRSVNVLNRISVISAVFVSAILSISIGSCMSNLQVELGIISSSDPEPFYVGVTYCGDSVSEAKQLIDKVKNYTNLFVLQSGSLQYGHRLSEIRQIVDYAVDSKLHFIVYFSQYWEFLNE
jgi:hypothetical protein